MGDLKRALESGAVLFVVILSAPLAALLAAVFLIYFYMIFFPAALGGTGELRDIFAMIYAFVYLTICFFAIRPVR
jgi:hypothetical protein